MESLLNKIAGPRPSTLINTDSSTGFFPVNIAKFLITAFFTEQIRWLLFKWSVEAHSESCETCKIVFNKNI